MFYLIKKLDYNFIKKNKTGKHYSKIYLNRCALVIKQLTDKDLNGINEESKKEFELQKIANEFFLDYLEEKIIIDSKKLQKIIDSLTEIKHKWLKDTLKLIYSTDKEES